MTHRPSTLTAHLRAPLALAATRLGLSSNAPRALKPRARHLLAPLAIAAMFLGLASNAAAQGPGGVPEYSTFPAAQVFTVGVEITPVTLPAASGGDAPLTYTLIPTVPGLTLHPTTRVLTGTPTTAAPLASYFIRAIDVDDETTQINFNITVNAGTPTGVTLSVDPAAVPESADATTITITATVVGGTFATDRLVAFASRDGGTATAGTDYTAVPATNLTLPANTASVSTTFPFTADVDTVAEPAGETVYIEGGVFISGSTLAIDPSITVTRAIITINDPPAATAAPAFAAGVTISPQRYVTGKMITPLTLPAATGGDGPIVYSMLAPNGAAITDLSLIIAGLTLDTTARTITGTPSTSSSARNFSWAAHDSDANMASGDRATLGFNITVQENLVPAFADGASIADQNHLQNSPITALTLPTATGGNGAITYTLTPAIPGLTLNPNTGVLTGTPTAAAASAAHTYTATDVDDDTVTLTFNAVVAADKVPTLGTATIADQSFVVGETVALTLPGVTPGSGNISIAYTLTPALPAGLTYNGNLRPPTITGSPTAVAATAEYTYMTTDGDGNTAPSDTDMRTFNLVVTAPVLAFTGNVSTLTLYYPLGAAITATTLPAATGGTSPYMYDTPAGATLPAGLTLDAATRTLSGTPSAAGSSSFNLRVTDSAMPAAMVSLEVTTVICESGGAADGGTVCAAPAFVPLALATPAEQAFRHIVSIAPVTLPEATGGSGASPMRIYTLTPLPVGLDFDPSTRVISGRPEALGTFTVNYRVGDAGAGNADTQSTTVMFDLVVFGRPFLPVIPDQVYAVGDTVALTLTVATGGSPPYTYTLFRQGSNDGLPAGLTWNTDVSPQTVTGMPTAVTALANYSYEVTDSRGLTNFKPFEITVNAGADTTPAFAADASIADQFYTVGTPITPLTLPEATGGNGALAYALLAPPGLNFDLTTRVLSGTPTTAAMELTYSYFARDADNDGVVLLIMITVNAADAADTAPAFAADAAIPFQRYVVGTMISTLTLPEATGGNDALTYTLARVFTSSVLPPGLTFDAAARTITGTPTEQTGGATGIAFAYTVADADGNTADSDTDTLFFTLAVSISNAGQTTLTFPATVGIGNTPNSGTIGLYYPLGQPITPTTFPTASGGTPSYTYSTSNGSPPPGLTFDAAVRVLSGTPTAAGSSSFDYRATDSATSPNSNFVPVQAVICESGGGAADGATVCPIPAFVTLVLPTPDDQLFENTFPISPVTLPEATAGGTGTNPVRIYTAMPLPVGLTFDPATRVISGRPEEAGTFTVNYRVGDAGAGNADFRSTTVTFDIVVGERLSLSNSFSPTYTVGDTVALTLPSGVGGTPPFTYALTGAAGAALTLPAGLTWNTGVTPQTITGMTTAAFAQTSYRYMVTDSLGFSTPRPFTLTVNADIAPAFADGATIPHRLYVVGTTMITPVTLPEATGGNDALTYTLARVNSSSGLPPGLTFNADARPPTITGTPSQQTGGLTPVAFAYTVMDADGNMAAGDSDTLFFSLGVFTSVLPVTFPTTTGIGFEPNTGTGVTLFYPLGAAITPTTFPAAIGGTGPYTYFARNGTPPPGLTFDADVRVLSGTPTAAGQSIFNYRVEDSAMPTAFRNLRVSTTICESGGAADGATACTVPTFAPLALPTPDEQVFVSGETITPLTLPEATSGGTGNNPVRIYTAMPLPAGLTFNPMTRAITGMPTAVGSTTVNYRVGDAGAGNVDHLSTTVTFDIVVAADTVPAFAAGAMIPDQFYTVNTAITPLTLPAVATAGNGDTVYVFNPPRGLTFDPSTRVLSGAPIAPTSPIPGEDTRTYTARDSDGNMAAGDEATLTFRLIVLRDTAPAFAVTDIMTRTYFMNEVVALTLPEATGGNGATTYTLTGATLPAGLTFDGTASPPTITGTAGTAATAMTFTYTAMDADDDAATLTISITVETMADTTPTFTAGAMIADQTFVQNRMLSLTLPAAATAGNGATIYTLTPAIAGLTLNPTTGVLTGTPEATVAETMYTYTASDSDGTTGAGDEATLTLQITVERQDPTGVTLSLAPDTVRESVAAQPITLTATLDGGTFGVERVVRFLTSSGVGTATEATDYTAVPATLLTLPANTASSSVDIRFTAPIDTDDEPAGETVVIGGFLQLPMGTGSDPSVPLTPATLTINDYTIIVGNAGPDQRVAPGDTIMFNAAITAQDETATVTSSWNLKDDAATTDALVAAGVARSAAGAESQRLRGRIRNFDTPTPSLPAPAADLGLTSAVELVFTFTASDTNAPQGYPLPVADEIIITVVPDTAPAFADDASIDNQTYIVGAAITALTLPTATGGNDAITYTLTPAIPGLTLDPTTGVLTGTPTTVAAAADYTYTASDSDANEMADDQTSLTFSITVNAAAAAVQPDFLQLISTVLGGPEGVTALATPTTFEPTAAGATVALTLSGPDAAFFSITQAGALSFRTAPDFEMPRGMAFNSVTNTNTYRVTVTATATPGGLTRDVALTVTITDVDETADTAPTFGAVTVSPQVFTIGTAVDLTLPAATGGNAPYTYTLVPGVLAPTLPDGLTFNAVARTLTGTPTTAAASADYTYTAADGDMNTAAEDTASLTISITVSAMAVVDSAPTFGGARIPAQIYTVDVPVNLTLPLPTSNIGDAPFTYDLLDSAGTVIPDLSAVIPGLTFTAAARTITGTPTAALMSTNFAYRVSDSDANMASSDTDSLSFSITVNTVEEDTAPTFFVDSFRELIFVVNVPIEPITLPSASGGNVAIVYGFSSPPVGLNFEPSTRVLSGTPTEVRVRTLYGYSVRDTDANSAGDDADTLLLGITVTARAGNLVPAFADDASIATQNYIVGSPIMPLTLPVASGGDGTLVYSLRHTGVNPTVITDLSSVIPGLTLDIAARTITGTPTTASGAAINYTWNAEDTDNDRVNLLFGISVLANAVPTFDTGSQRIANQAYSVRQTVLVTLPPTATSGNGPTVYTLTPALPDGLTFTPAARTISGMPATETASAEYTYTARDSDSNTLPADEASLTFTVTVTGETAGTAPSFGTATDESRTYIAGLAIEPLTLPVATGGDGAITYTLTGPSNAALNTAVPGLTFDAATRTLSGTPTTVAVSTDLTYTAGDTDDSAPGTDEVTLTLSITIEAGTGTAPPTFGGATVSPQAYFVGTTITSLTLPVATGGTGAITYTLTPALPTGLIFNATARTITGTASAAAGATDYTYTATDGDMNTATLMFSITIDTMDTAPAFAGSASITAQTYMVNTAIMPLTLPAVTDGTGNGAITYTLSPAIPGLTLNPTSRVLTGTPTTVPTVTMYTYTAADSDDTTGAGDEVSLMFSITVIQAPPTAIRLSVNPAAVTESDDPTTITVTATLIGGSYSTAQTITVRSIDGTATSADYTPVSTPLTIPANATSGIATFMFTTVVDTVAEPGGETVLIMGLPVNGIMVSPATLTINDYDLVVDAGADQTVASGSTIMLNGEITGSTDTTTAWALSDSAATRAALEAAGLTTAEATTEVGRLTTALAGTGPDRTFPAPAANLGLTDPVALAFTLTVTDNAPPGGQDAATAMDEVTITVEANTTAVTTTLNEAILPEVTRALVHSTSSSITRRVGQAVGSIPTVGSFNLAGQQMGGERNLASALRTHGETMSADSRDIKEMLAGSEFVLPLNAGGAGIDPSSVAFWGSGEYRDFSGESDDLDWDGDLTGFQLGLDARLRNNLLVGVAVSMLETDVDYQDDTGILGQGDYELDLTSAHPYIGWRADELDLWATVGYGTGDLEITGQGETAKSGDVNLQTIGGGGSGMLWQDGTTTLRLKAEVSQTQLEVKGSDDFAKQEIDATGIRIAVEATRPRTLDGGGIFEPSVEVAARYDGGDGETGGGAEVGGALRYRNPATGLTADGRIRALIGQGGDYEEWGISGTIRVAPGTDGQGLSFSLRPGYGNSASGIQELWRHGLADENDATTDDYAMKLDARVGYGFGFILNEHHGVLTPYSEMTYGNIDSYRMGLNWAANTRFDLTLLGERRENTGDPAEHAVLLKGEVRF